MILKVVIQKVYDANMTCSVARLDFDLKINCII